MKDKGFKINAKIIQVGTSLGVIIPTVVCKSMNIKKGSLMEAELKSNQIILTKEETD